MDKFNRIKYRGGPGSGHHGHAGRPGQRGGSAPRGGGNEENLRTGRIASEEETRPAGARGKLLQKTPISELVRIDAERYFPAVLDEWANSVGGIRMFSPLEHDLPYWGEGVVRLETEKSHYGSLPVKIRVTGRKLHSTYTPGTYKVRVQYEHLKDGEESVFGNGFVYVHDVYNVNEINRLLNE